MRRLINREFQWLVRRFVGVAMAAIGKDREQGKVPGPELRRRAPRGHGAWTRGGPLPTADRPWPQWAASTGSPARCALARRPGSAGRSAFRCAPTGPSGCPRVGTCRESSHPAPGAGGAKTCDRSLIPGSRSFPGPLGHCGSEPAVFAPQPRTVVPPASGEQTPVFTFRLRVTSWPRLACCASPSRSAM